MTHDEWSARSGEHRDSDRLLPDDLLDRYLAGETSAGERALIERMLAEVPADAALATYVMAWKQRQQMSTVDDARVRIARRIGGYPGAAAQDFASQPRVSDAHWGRTHTVLRGRGGIGTRTLRRSLWSAGAVVVAVLAFMLVLDRTPRASAVTRTYATQSGQQSTFTLIDGTRVTLAPRTTLRLIRFGPRSRQVELDGQAYFEVTRSTQVPFRVRTGSLATQVLGTAFLVRHYAGDPQLHVAVAEGKVTVAPDVSSNVSTEVGAHSRVARGDMMRARVTGSSGIRSPVSWPVLLTAGHVGDITDSTILVNRVNDLHEETDWLRGSLVFRHTSVGEVLQTLSRWYGYQFRCSDSTIARRSVTLALNAKSSAKALETLEQILSVHLTITGDTVTLSSRKTPVPGANARTRAYDLWIPTREAGR